MLQFHIIWVVLSHDIALLYESAAGDGCSVSVRHSLHRFVSLFCSDMEVSVS